MENGFYVAASTQFIADGNTLRELLATGQVQITDASGQPVNVVSVNCNLLKTCKKTVQLCLQLFDGDQFLGYQDDHAILAVKQEVDGNTLHFQSVINYPVKQSLHSVYGHI